MVSKESKKPEYGRISFYSFEWRLLINGVIMKIYEFCVVGNYFVMRKIYPWHQSYCMIHFKWGIA